MALLPVGKSRRSRSSHAIAFEVHTALTEIGTRHGGNVNKDLLPVMYVVADQGPIFFRATLRASARPRRCL